MTNKSKLVSLWVALAVVLSLVAPAFAADPTSSGSRVNINSADVAQFVKLPQVGAKMAQRIVDYRKANGPFKRAEDLMKVKGIGTKVFAKLQPLITV